MDVEDHRESVDCLRVCGRRGFEDSDGHLRGYCNVFGLDPCGVGIGGGRDSVDAWSAFLDAAVGVYLEEPELADNFGR